MLICVGCEWHLKSNEETSNDNDVTIERYDRIESLYLTTGDYSALLQMNKSYPMQTRTLIEDVLRIGKVNEPDINVKFLQFFGDSILQQLINDVQEQYANIDDINKEMTDAFHHLREAIPSLEMPQVYSQIGSFDQSIIVGGNYLGISLDKYLGADYPFYVEHYSEGQRRLMTRSCVLYHKAHRMYSTRDRNRIAAAQTIQLESIVASAASTDARERSADSRCLCIPIRAGILR